MWVICKIVWCRQNLFYSNLSSVATGGSIQAEGSLLPHNLHVWRHSADVPRVINKLPFDGLADKVICFPYRKHIALNIGLELKWGKRRMFRKALSDSQRENTSVQALQAGTQPQDIRYEKNIKINWKAFLSLDSLPKL